MKKMRLTAILAFMTLSMSNLFAQVIETAIPNLQGKSLSAQDLEFFNKKNDIKFNKKANVSQWYSYTSALGDNGERFTYFTGTHMWPDSLPLLNFTTGADHVGLHAIGQVFDPKSFYFIDPTPQFSKFTKYTVDSVAFFYKYLNLNGIADTLLVQFYGADKIVNLSFGGGATPTRSVVLNRSTSTGSDATSFIKIPLDMMSNTEDFFLTGISQFSGTIQVPVGLSIPADGLFAYTATFLPGNYPYALGDTLATDSTMIPQKKLNCFVPLVFRGDGAASGLDNSFNLGLFAFSNQKYSPTSTRPTEWFYPANAPGVDKQYIPSQFYINTTNLSAANIKGGYGIGNAYPNPVAQATDVQLDFSIGKSENVSIDLYDLLGKKVKSISKDAFAAGNHTVSFNTAGLPSGVYIYQIKAGEFSASRKLTIN